MDNAAVATLISFVCIIIGIFGLVFPALPGAVLIWLGIVAYGILNPFVHWSTTFYVIQGILALLTYAVDYIATVWGVKKFKGSKAGAIGAVAGMLFVLVVGPAGIIIGPFIGALIGELIHGEELRQALLSGLGSFLGFLMAMFLRLMICGAMLAWFISKILMSHAYRFHFHTFM